jgi:hypothetical protein
MPASERYRLPWGRKLILVAFIASDFVNLACRLGYLCCRCGDFSGNLSEEYPTSSLGSSQLWENELNKSSIWSSCYQLFQLPSTILVGNVTISASAERDRGVSARFVSSPKLSGPVSPSGCGFGSAW